jgi:hypothetical protein
MACQRVVLLFGPWLLFDDAMGWRGAAVAVTGSVAAVAMATAVVRFGGRRPGGTAISKPLKSSPEKA